MTLLILPLVTVSVLCQEGSVLPRVWHARPLFTAGVTGVGSTHGGTHHLYHRMYRSARTGPSPTASALAKNVSSGRTIGANSHPWQGNKERPPKTGPIQSQRRTYLWLLLLKSAARWCCAIQIIRQTPRKIKT